MGHCLDYLLLGFLTKRKLNEKLIWTVCIIAAFIDTRIDILSSPDGMIKNCIVHWAAEIFLQLYLMDIRSATNDPDNGILISWGYGLFLKTKTLVNAGLPTD